MTKILALTATVAAGLASAALLVGATTQNSADTFTLRVISQDATTIRLGWDPQPGDGYQFSRNGVNVSRTFDPSRTSVRFEKGTSYAVTVLHISTGAVGVYPTGSPPPTTSTAPTTSTSTTTPTTSTTTPVPPGAKTATPATFSSVLAGLRPGETLVMEDGVYAPFTVNVANVTIQARHKWSADVDAKYANWAGVILGSGAANVVLDGLEIMRATEPAPNSGGSSGVDIYNGGAGSTIRNCNIHDIGNNHTSSSSNGQNGVFVEVDNVTIEGNFLHDIGRTNTDNHDHGVYADGARGLDGMVVRNNFFRDIRSGWAIQLYPGTLNGIDIGGNTFVHGNPIRANSQIVIGRATFGGGSIHDNLFWDDNGSGAALYPDGFSGSLAVNNNRYTQPSLINGSTPAGMTLSGNTKVSVAKPADPS